jgi:transposase InsO family protein
MAWKDVQVSEQRARFVLRASRGEENFSGLCREFDISRTTGYYWLRRYRETERIDGLGDRSRRPHTSPQRTSAAVQERVLSERRARPDWGARKIEVLLKRDQIALPKWTIHRILKREGMIKPHNQHPAAIKRFQREEPNQLWQMDFKGLPPNLSQGWQPLSILDDCSRFAAALKGLRTNSSQAVRQVLEEIFPETGLPEAMLIDHGTPWWSAHHPSGWTRLSIWLMKLGIKLYLCAVRHPQTQGKVERFHRSLQDALHERGFPADRDAWPAWLEGFRKEYNEVRPHEALEMETPASRWRPSERPFGPIREWEYPCGASVRSLSSSGQLYVEGHQYTVTGALAGERVQLEYLAQDRILIYYRRTCVREIQLQKRQSYPVYFSRTEPVFVD